MQPTFPQIILLNGASSSGKSSIAKELQLQLSPLFLHLQLDAIIETLPDTHSVDDFYRMVDAFHHAIAAVVGADHPVIVDHVLLDNDWLHQCADLFAPHALILVGVDCSLEELERRERTRDACRQGFARSQYDKVHEGKAYDVRVNTESGDPVTCARQILDFYIKVNPQVS